MPYNLIGRLPPVVMSYNTIKIVPFITFMCFSLMLTKNCCGLEGSLMMVSQIKSQAAHLKLIRNSIPKFENKTLKIVVVVREPFVSYTEPTRSISESGPLAPLNDLDNYSGVAIEVVRRLANVFKFNVIVTRTMDNQFGVQGMDGRWTGLVGSLVRNESDMGVTALSITASRGEFVDFTRAYYVETASILLRTPDEVQNFFVVFEPFSTAVWLLLIAFIFMLIFLLIIMTKLEDSQRERHKLHKLAKQLERHRHHHQQIQGEQIKKISGSLSGSWRGASTDENESLDPQDDERRKEARVCRSGKSGSLSSMSNVTGWNVKQVNSNHGKIIEAQQRDSVSLSYAKQIELELALINHVKSSSEFGKTLEDRFYYSVGCVLNILLNKGELNRVISAADPKDLSLDVCGPRN